MHRSGTSAVTRVFSLLGAELPKHLMPPAKDNNEAGFWEPLHLAHLHDRFLSEAHSSWDDWRAFNPADLEPRRLGEIRNEIKKLISEEFGGSKLFVLKDPRICRFVRFYQELLADIGIEARFVIPYRNPLAVIASLGKRDGMSQGFAGLLWLRHILDAEAMTRGQRRTFIAYEDLMDDWRGAVGRACEELGLSRSAGALEAAADDITNSLRPDLQHHNPNWTDLASHPTVTTWVKDAYRALTDLVSGNPSGSSQSEFDRIGREFEAGTPLFADAMFAELHARRIAYESERKRLANIADGYRAENQRLSTEGEVKDSQIADLVEQKSALGKSLEVVRAEAQTNAAEAAHLSRELAIQKLKADKLQAVLGSMKDALAVHEEQLASKTAAVERLTGIVRAGERRLVILEDMLTRSEKTHLQEMQSIFSSTSWRVTKPLRLAKQYLAGALYVRRNR
jgi:hypothetical protein